VSLHRRVTHPVEQPGCFGCHVSTLRVAHTSEWARDKTREKQLSRDLEAYARLRGEGLRPEAVDGAARAEQAARHSADINMASYPGVAAMNTGQKNELVQAAAQW